MSTKTENPKMTPRRRGRRRFAIIGLALLTVITIIYPQSAPISGAGVIIFLCIGLWDRSRSPFTTDSRGQGEPSLWDDGTGTI